MVTVFVGPVLVTVTLGETAVVVADDMAAPPEVVLADAAVAGGWVTMTEVAGSEPVQAASRGAATASRRTWRSGFVFIPIPRAAFPEVVRAA
jgi:hypothetical protein